MATIFKRKGTGPYVIQYYDHSGKRREKSSRTTDKRAAERIAAKLEADVALRREGVVDARQDRFAEADRSPLRDHVDAYHEHCSHVGHAPRHVVEKRRHLDRLLAGTGATRLSELTADALERNLREMRAEGLSARTVNIRRQIAVAFLNWCVQTERTEANPLTVVQKLDESRDRRRIRRALTDEEMTRLIDVAAPRGRKAWYLTAALAGLRKSELRSLTWGDVDLDANTLTVREGKAHRVDVLPLHPQLVEALSEIQPELALPSARVFPQLVTDRTRHKDFERAKIPLEDDAGHVVDLHSLRTTLGTRLARQGVTPQVGQRIMRHADYRTTLKHYTVLGLVDSAKAIDALPEIGTTNPQCEQATGTAGSDPQQIPQQSAHETMRKRAVQCDEQPSATADTSKGETPSPTPLRGSVRPDASQRTGAGDRIRTGGSQLGKLTAQSVCAGGGAGCEGGVLHRR